MDDLASTDKLLAYSLLCQKMPQIVRHVLCRHVPLSCSLRQSFEANPLQLLRDCLINLPKRAWLKVRDLFQQFLFRIALERTPAGEQFVADHAQAENVRTPIDPMPFSSCLLRTHVSGSPGILRASADIFFLERQSEISD